MGAGAPPIAWSWIAELARAARKAVDRKLLWETGAAKAQLEKVTRTMVQRILISLWWVNLLLLYIDEARAHTQV